MVDGTNCSNVATPSDNIRKNSLLKLWKEITKDGKTAYYYKYSDLTFRVQDNSVSFGGSLHQYYNNGFNNNDFTRSQLIEVLNDLWEKFGINPYCTPLNSVEVGVNINFNPEKFIQSIIDYKGKYPKITNKDFLYSECEISRYTMKAYDKDSLLRIEVRFDRTEDIKKKDIKFLSDLTIIENWQILSEFLLKYYDNYLIYDNTLNIHNIAPRERELILNGQNPRYWDNLHNTSPENYKKRRARFRELIQKYQQNNIQNEVRNLIVEKINLLIEPDAIFPELTDCKTRVEIKTSPELTDCKTKIEIKTFPELTEICKPNYHDFDNIINNDFPRSNTSDEPAKRGKWTPPKLYSLCLITKLKIHNQKPGSKFLSISGIKYLLETNKSKFEQLKKDRLTHKWLNEPLEVQIREIAHSIRNKYYNPKNNPRNNTKKSIRKINSYPVLFETWHLIRQDKRQIAGYYTNETNFDISTRV